MNARTPFPPGAKPTPSPFPIRTRQDQEFLPAALEILETPPSPVGVWLLWIICALAVCGLTWAYFGRLDVVAIAQGKIQPTGRVKVIQPLEPGKISGVFVENGQHVHQGDVLATLDSAELDADVNGLLANLNAFRAEAARRRAALAAGRPGVMGPFRDIVWDESIPPAVRLREEHVFRGDLDQLTSAVQGLRAQMRQKTLEQQRYAAATRVFESLVATLQQRVDMRSVLEARGAGSKADLIDAVETLQEQAATLATSRGQILESAESVEVLARSIDDSYHTFAAQNFQKLAEAERQVDDFAQRLEKAKVRQGGMVIRSPIDGTVSSLALTTLGQVVASGDEIMRVVPNDLGIEIEAYLPNRDIGFVHTGAPAIVKIESLPFTRYGTVGARLTRVASDAIPEPDADQTEGNPGKAQKERGFAGAQRTQNLVFPTTFKLSATSILADGARVPLSPGMAVTVEIKTGSRRIIEYVFSPLVEVAAQAMKER